MPQRDGDTENAERELHGIGLEEFRVPLSSLCLCVSVAILVFASACSRFHNAPADSKDARFVVISPIYNEIIWALGAQDRVVAVDLSTTYPPDVKKVQTVGYHRALSAEGILSLHPTAIIHDGNIGPPNVVQQLQSLNIPMKTFTAKNDSFDNTKALIREMGRSEERRVGKECRSRWSP